MLIRGWNNAAGLFGELLFSVFLATAPGKGEKWWSEKMICCKSAFSDRICLVVNDYSKNQPRCLGIRMWIIIYWKREGGYHTCQASGTFFRFNSTSAIATILSLDKEPGPMTVNQKMLDREFLKAARRTAVQLRWPRRENWWIFGGTRGSS